MKLIITESAQQKLIKKMIHEEICGMSDKVNLVKQFLDKNFLKATKSIIGDNGHPKSHDIVIWVDDYKQPKQYLEDTDLFYIIQDQFKNILPPDEDTDEIEDIFDDAYEKAEKKVKKLTHNNRDKFLKQCIKDWYYNKISKNGNLSLYEEMRPLNGLGRGSNNYHRGDATRWNINSRDYKIQLQSRINDNNECKDATDNTLDGHAIIKDINFLIDNFFTKKEGKRGANGLLIAKGCPTKDMLINDIVGSYSDTRPDLYYLLQKILSSRASAKWCYICPSLAKNLDPRWNQIKAMASKFGPNELFQSKEERDMYLPFYTPLFKKYITPFLLSHKDLKTEIEQSQTMTPELNVKIEEYLNSVGYPYVEPTEFIQDDFSDFESYD